MGANSSTCLPCKAAGASNPRSKVASFHRLKDAEKHSALLKKVSTAAEPQVGSLTAAPVPNSGLNMNNGAVISSVQPLHKCSEIPQQGLPAHAQGQSSPVVQTTDGCRLKEEVTGDKQVLPPTLEEEERPDKRMAQSGSQNHSNKAVDQDKGSTGHSETMEQPSHTDVLQHQSHILVPSHLLATEAEESWQQHPDIQQALLSPHSRSVAHRVAAALRAAAGERAAAAAARAAEAVGAAKTTPTESMEQLEKLEPLNNFSACSTTDFRRLRQATESREDSEEQMDRKRQCSQRPSGQDSRLYQMSCFSNSKEVGEGITIQQSLEKQQEAECPPPSDYSVIVAAKRMGEMLSWAAAAATSVTCLDAGEKMCASDGDNAITSEDRWGSELDRKERLVETQLGGESSCELGDNAAVFLGAMDRAMDVVGGDNFKNQAVTLLSQSITVAASVVNAVKKCGDAPKYSSGFPQSHPFTGHDKAGHSTNLVGYYKALQISAQQQLALGKLQPQLSAC